MKHLTSLRYKNGLLTFILLIFISSVYSQVGIGTTSPNANALLDLDATTSDGGLLLPRIALSGTGAAAPLSAHVQGMTIFNTATAGNVTPGIYINDGSAWLRVEDQSPVADSRSLAADRIIDSPTYANIPGTGLTFVARKTSVLVTFSASGFGYTNSMSIVRLRVRNATTNTIIGGTHSNIQNQDTAYDPATMTYVFATTTTWSAAFSTVLSGLTIGTSYTLRPQGSVVGLFGTYDAVIEAATDSDAQHLTLTVTQ